ncbi:MAG: DNA polymerase III subunit gamma/tau [Christensenellales bacterium]
MYQSLYRKWRPRTFSDMVGQDSIVKTLKNQVATGHIAHAYLFCGTRGTGKTSAARILAMAINCENPSSGDPCLECDSCDTILRDASIDIFEMDAASNSRVEEIRDMLEKVNYPPQQAKYKVYIIDEVHMLSNAAFNALLKTLEEPPSYMVFILATTEPQKLPATILSRCQRFDFGRISEEDIISRLKIALDNNSYEEEALELIAMAAEGSMRDAWSLMDMCLEPGKELLEENVRTIIGSVSSEFLFEFFNAIISKDMNACLKLIDKLMFAGKETQVFLNNFSRYIRELISLALAPIEGKADSMRLSMQEQAKKTSVARLILLLEECMKTEASSKWSSSPRGNLEAFALRACLSAHTDDDVIALKARIDELEKSISAIKAGNIEQSLSYESDTKKDEASVPDTVIEHEVVDNAVYVNDAKDDAIKAENNIAPETINGKEKAEVVNIANVEQTSDAITAAKEELQTKIEKKVEKPSASADENIIEEITGDITPKDAWNNMLKRAQKELTSSFGIIQQGKYGGFSDGKFTLLYEKGKEAYLAFMNEDARKNSVEKLLSEEMKKSVTFEAKLISYKPSVKAIEQAKNDISLLSSLVGRENVIVKDE